MEALYLRDLANSTELVLDDRHKLRAPGQPRRPRGTRVRGSGSTGAVAAGAMRIGNAVGAVFSRRRVLGPVQGRLTTGVGLVLCVVAVLVAVFPRALALPVAAAALWGGLALLWRGFGMLRSSKEASARDGDSAPHEPVPARGADTPHDDTPPP
ncbi:MAG TPA: hypothetical protein PKB14_15665 [Rubrivivax sp.]|nr:hypothetical protein [Rubrivivax sp.]